MAATEVGTATTNSVGGDVTSIASTVPTVGGGILNGDIHVVLNNSHEAEDDNLSGVPSGMDGTLFVETLVGGSPPSFPGVIGFYELCEGSESGTRTVSGDFPCSRNCIGFVVRGGDVAQVEDVADTTASGAASANADPAAIDTSGQTDGDLIVAVVVHDHASTTPESFSSGPSNMDGEIAQIDTPENTGGAMGAWYFEQASAGAFDPNTTTFSISDEWGSRTVAFKAGATATTEQEGFRFFDDDADEDESTALENQGVDLSIGKEMNFRLRMGHTTSGDTPTGQRGIQVRKVGDPDSEWEDV